MHGLLSCTDELMKSAERASYSKKDRHPTTNRTMHQWKELELDYLNDLIQETKRFCAEVDQAKKEADAASRVSIPSFRDFSLVETRKQTTRQFHFLRDIVSTLEVEILQERHCLDVWEASSAPSSAILCQATEKISLCGFCFEHFDDINLILRYHHAAPHDVETRVVFTIAPDSFSELVIEPLFMSETESPIIDCHKEFMKLLVEGNMPLAKEIRHLDLQQAMLRLSRWLGKMDLVIADLTEITADGKVSVAFHLPSIVITMTSGAAVHVTLDLSNDFHISEVAVSTPGMNVQMISCKTGQTLLDIVSTIDEVHDRKNRTDCKSQGLHTME
jgi:hypothetical protein